MKKVVVLMLAVLIICSSSMAFAGVENYSDSTNVVADALFLKPLGLVATAFGSITFLVSWPFAAMTDSDDETFQTLVKEPFDYTFKRPVGKIGTGF